MDSSKPLDFVLAPDNEPPDARRIREAFLEVFSRINPLQAFHFNYLVRGAVTTARAEIVETLELTRAAGAIRAKLDNLSETLDTRVMQALALRDVHRDFGRLDDLLKTQNWGSRESSKSLRQIAADNSPLLPPDVPSCMQDLVEDSGLRYSAPPILKAA